MFETNIYIKIYVNELKKKDLIMYI